MVDHPGVDRNSYCRVCDRVTGHRLCFRKQDCDILKCHECGLGSADTKDFDPAAYYTDAYFDGGYGDGYADYAGSEAVLRREFRDTLRHLKRFVGSGRLLEVGCAYGFFLLEAKSSFQVAGIEAAEGAVRACHARGLSDVRVGLIDRMTIAEFPPMDAIVLLDVIEHLAAPDEAFRLLSSKLKPGGMLLLTTGDWNSLVGRAFGSRWRLMTPPQHLFYFTARSLRILGQRYGLQVVDVGHPWKTVPLSLVAHQLRRMIGLAAEPPRASGHLSGVGIPVNLFDAIRVVYRKDEHATSPPA